MAEPTAKVYNKRVGWPAGAVYVGRPSKWGNPFVVVTEDAREEAIELFRESITEEFKAEIRRELRGKDLVCWCAPKPCHADVLLEIANG